MTVIMVRADVGLDEASPTYYLVVPAKPPPAAPVLVFRHKVLA
jgi:hypothetical protein